MAYVIIALCFGLAGGSSARSRASSFWLWFLISGLVPFLGLLAAIAYRSERDELRRTLPGLRARDARSTTRVCTRCGTELDFPDVRRSAPES